ncbi:SDR family oxidoreductase [Bradyrhizobium sp. LTSP857]|jgi:NAD(P)-dependent dehydrogenase (short-subunit alcohol dehydrogenase family)|uniref:SDR family oxidoreductase n=1 Tax=Bradyrhizobium sp. LTSP857 TaxID=1619231 RepID=UPI0005D23EDF|nr:SDR family oxidoreductase [Bradyrhizobium sp. LTSP857]KJC52377.1 short-chain dehydrogenase [Bradyrhizobium sp. LTSP857]
MHGDLKNSRFLVIGGSSGIGLAVAMAATNAGAAVTIASRSRAKLDSALADSRLTARGRQLDIIDHPAVESFFADEAAWDHVVVSAAQTTSGPVRKLGLSEARDTMDSKFWGAYHVARSAKFREHGSLCLISGFRGVRPSANTVLQGAVNAALEALARGLALELAPIRVNVVSPGLIATPLWAGMAETEREAMFTSAAERLPLRRIGQSSDVANAVLFLASSPFSTGSTVVVDGGGIIAA